MSTDNKPVPVIINLASGKGQLVLHTVNETFQRYNLSWQGHITHPFVLHPIELQAPDKELIGAASVHELGKSWLQSVQGTPASERRHLGGHGSQNDRIAPIMRPHET